LLKFIIRMQSIFRGMGYRKKVKASKTTFNKRNHFGNDNYGKFQNTQSQIIVRISFNL
jgi:hypothetical protein